MKFFFNAEFLRTVYERTPEVLIFFEHLKQTFLVILQIVIGRTLIKYWTMFFSVKNIQVGKEIMYIVLFGLTVWQLTVSNHVDIIFVYNLTVENVKLS